MFKKNGSGWAEGKKRGKSFYENREKLDSFFGTFLWHFLVSLWVISHIFLWSLWRFLLPSLSSAFFSAVSCHLLTYFISFSSVSLCVNVFHVCKKKFHENKNKCLIGKCKFIGSLQSWLATEKVHVFVIHYKHSNLIARLENK